jgi:FMN phosphatase YigB (HAD superfamily)
MKLIIDFDDVLFKVSNVKTALFAALKSHGVNNPEEYYAEERKMGRPFSLKKFLAHVYQQENIFGISVEEMHEEIMSVCKDSVNTELVELVRTVGKENCYIVTSGDEEFQKDKIARAGLNDLIREIIVVPGSKKEAVQSLCGQYPNEEVIFIDDKNTFFTDIDMEACRNLKTVLYNENGYENLKAEMEESKRVETSRNAPPAPPMR